MRIGIKKLREDAVIPTYADAGASGFDFYIPKGLDAQCVWPGHAVAIPTGLAFEIPNGYEIQVRGRSGLAFKESVVCHFGTIDSSYKGEVKLLLINFGQKMLKFEPGQRVAQGVLAPVIRAEFAEVDELSDSERGANGFGSSGK